MIPIELKKRYPHSRDEDITDAFMRGYQAHGDAVQIWIPCSERLPKTPKHYYEKSLYLTCTKTGYITSTYWCDGWNCLMKEDGTVYREYEMKDIVAWMPLPKPYREDGEA